MKFFIDTVNLSRIREAHDIKHLLTEIGLAKFLEDAKKCNQYESKRIKRNSLTGET